MSIERFRNSEGEIWVNVASSTFVVPSFVNLDNHVFLAFGPLLPLAKRVLPSRYRAALDDYRHARSKALLIRHDCRKPLFFPDQSVDHILCSHFLEHVYPQEMQQNLRDYFRVLKPGATLHVIVPDLEAHARTYLARKTQDVPDAADEFMDKTILSTRTRGSLTYRMLEFMGHGLQHRWMYDRDSMRLAIERAGFTIVDSNDTPSRAYRLGDASVHVVARRPRSTA